MTDRFLSFPAFDRANPNLRTELAGEELLLTRVARTRADDAFELTAPPQDAFALIFQLAQAPEHAMSYDGQRVDVATGPVHAISAVDLSGEVSARIDVAFDSLNFRVPRAALDIFADQAGSSRVSRLHWPDQAFTSTDPAIARLAPALIAAMGVDRASPLFVDHLLLALTAHVLGRYGDGPVTAARASGTLTRWQERRAQAMLDPGEHPSPSLSEVAVACGISVAHFSRAFKAGVGVSPWAWHQARRIERAQTLLRDTALPLAQVAAIAGFADQSHFGRAFAGRTGVSPGQWRRDRGIG